MTQENNIEASILNAEIATDELFMNRCIGLAKLGAGWVAPNPMVGAILVHEGRIIGEGYHQHYGEAHAEVNCIASVLDEDRLLIPKSKLYVSLEPCAHHGKTPPCADLIVRNKIPEVIIGCRDPFPEVNGKGIEKLKAAGVHVTLGVLETACQELNKRFFLFHSAKRPYIILKWAQTADGFLAKSDRTRTFISNEFTNRLVHQWRAEEASILVGTNTALYDNPELTVRNWKGPNPVRLVMDRNLRLPASLKLFDRQSRTIVFNHTKNEKQSNLEFLRIDNADHFLEEMNTALYHLHIQSILVEGGSQTLDAFIEKGNWDEARIITNERLYLEDGIVAPALATGHFFWEKKLFSDHIVAIKNIS